jgi:polysaccharide deacetylase 2 family uncharacterized protein YibQ
MLLRTLEPLNLARLFVVAAALVVIAAALAGPPSGAMIMRANLPPGETQVVEEPTDELDAWTAVPSLSASPKFELSLAREQSKRRIAAPAKPLPAPAPPTRSAEQIAAVAPAAGRLVDEPPRPKPATALATKLAMLPVVPRKDPRRPTTGARLAIIIDDLGPAEGLTRKAIALPRPLTLAFLPYARDLPQLTAAARARGHEIFLHLPMEPVGSPDPGPNAILVDLEPDEFRRRLNWAFNRMPLATGLNNHMGSRATADPEVMLKVLQEVRRRGLNFVDSRTSPLSVADGLAAQLQIPHVARDVFLDNNPTTGAILVQLTLAERLARQQGHAVAIGHPYPATLAVLAKWLPEAEVRGIRIVRAQDLIAAQDCRPGQPVQVNACVGPRCPPPPKC